MKRIEHIKLNITGQLVKALFLFLLFFSVDVIRAQQPANESYPVRLFSVSSNDGLSQGFVPCIRQDHRGFIWFATKDGLNKYDGYKFIVYRHDPIDPHSIADNLITGITEDSRGYIWVSTPGKLDVYDPQTERFYSIDYSPVTGKRATEAHRIIEDAFGNMWFLSHGEYFCMTVALVNPQAASFDEKYKCTTKQASVIFAKCNFPKSEPQQFYFDGKGDLWITFADSLFQLTQKDQSAGIVTHRYSQSAFCGLPESKILLLMRGKADQTYLITTSGVVVYNIASGKIEKTFPVNINEFGYENACRVDENRNAWLGFNKSLYFLNYNANTIQKVTPVNIPENTWASYAIESVLVDQSGIVWMGTNGFSVYKYNPFVAKFHLSETGPMGWINADRDGNIYYNARNCIRQFNPGTQKAGEAAFTGGIFQVEINKETVSYPNSFTQDKQGIFWLTYGHGYLGRYDSKKNKIQFYHTDVPPNSLTGATKIWLDKNDHPWILLEDTMKQCSITGFDPATEKFSSPALFPDKEIVFGITNVSAVSSAAGNFWFATNHGLFGFDPGKNAWKQYENIPGYKTSLSNNFVFSLCNDPQQPDAYLWVGTNSGGLNRLTIATGKFECFTDKDGLPNNVIYGVLSDNNGNLWLSTNKGLCRFNIATKECKNFYASDGLQSNEFNRYSYCKSSTGALYFGGVSGLNFFYPEELNSGVHAPVVRFTGLRLFNDDISFTDATSPIQKPVDFLEEIVLAYNQNVITLKFSAMDYAAPEKNQFRYKLEGFDNDWNFSGTRNEAIYTGLAPGEYKFTVKASNSMGIWSEVRSLRIIILPPWWKTWWAMILYVFTGIGLILLFLWMRTAALRKNQKVLEEKVKERTQELKASISYLKQTQDQLVQNEKLASFGQLTAGIAHEIKNPLNFINNFSELSNELIEELKDAQTDEERKEILDSLKNNLLKINHHGGRVDSIIKSMLQHSRSAGSLRQPTDINKLCDEYTNLAYHSMRANVPDFTCNIQKLLDPGLPVLFAIPQDISRVVLNLLNNAFYAVNERRKVSGEDFKPELIVSTSRENNMAVIRIRDNGSGMPEEVKKKLFTPFFTTKPSGEGTGLGLSISSDIIRTHGGTLNVESVQNEFTEFTIRIPLQDSTDVKPELSHSLN
jgi:signal transduction histidine kinase/ligand-binding sensor domain-containing protein